MIRCPQCGATVSVPEQELHPECPFCGTAFLIDGDHAARHVLVPASRSSRQLRQALRDRLHRSSGAAAAAVEPELQIFYFPFRRSPGGTYLPAFESHVPELSSFRVPGSDWKPFREEMVETGAIVLEPEEGAGDPEAADGTILHYPIARAAVSLAMPTAGPGPRAEEEELVVWIDASRGRVIADNLGTLEPTPRRLPPRLLGTLAAVYFGAFLLLPIPWSVMAAAVATPFLHRWSLRVLRTASP